MAVTKQLTCEYSKCLFIIIYCQSTAVKQWQQFWQHSVAQGENDIKPKFDKAIYCEHLGQSQETSLRLSAKNSYTLNDHASCSVPGSVNKKLKHTKFIWVVTEHWVWVNLEIIKLFPLTFVYWKVLTNAEESTHLIQWEDFYPWLYKHRHCFVPQMDAYFRFNWFLKLKYIEYTVTIKDTAETDYS